ncbi:glutamine ABC transporter substrate-binding protein [Parabacteroides sp. 52]|uniref:transporter substrate-binding domain-containing protein n=1 Tax=unclassified Parabacteroides TaxID=2649774 RepID=UPI0013D38793|nr:MULTISPECIES: transporter substrate-binding domain-containing protein [unclassified Parabacteroides]MDH6534045.1 membrane-bound lytic murein transglycosylase F [Parabacteroides sp. PM5-20]NDV54787.1 glutamine ABC transporter substrate-binding protein [Parabacteroides sp. 52]
MKSKRLLLLYVCLLPLVVCTMLLLAPQKKAPLVRDYNEIKEEGILRLITEYSQTGYYVSGDTIEGFQYELGQALSRLSGLEIEIHLEMNLNKSFAQLASGKCDVIARNIPITSELKNDYIFTEPIVLNKQVLVQRTAKANNGHRPLRNQLDLAQKTLHIPKSSPALLRLHNLEQEIGDTIHVVEDELYASEQLIIMVAKGDIDYAVCDQQIARQAQKRLPEIDIQTDISFTQLQAWAVRKEAPVLLDSLNSWFKQIRKSGLYNDIYKRYY